MCDRMLTIRAHLNATHLQNRFGRARAHEHLQPEHENDDDDGNGDGVDAFKCKCAHCWVANNMGIKNITHATACMRLRI